MQRLCAFAMLEDGRIDNEELMLIALIMSHNYMKIGNYEGFESAKYHGALKNIEITASEIDSNGKIFIPPSLKPLIQNTLELYVKNYIDLSKLLKNDSDLNLVSELLCEIVYANTSKIHAPWEDDKMDGEKKKELRSLYRTIAKAKKIVEDGNANNVVAKYLFSFVNHGSESRYSTEAYPFFDLLKFCIAKIQDWGKKLSIADDLLSRSLFLNVRELDEEEIATEIRELLALILSDGEITELEYQGFRFYAKLMKVEESNKLWNNLIRNTPEDLIKNLYSGLNIKIVCKEDLDIEDYKIVEDAAWKINGPLLSSAQHALSLECEKQEQDKKRFDKQSTIVAMFLFFIAAAFIYFYAAHHITKFNIPIHLELSEKKHQAYEKHNSPIQDPKKGSIQEGGDAMPPQDLNGDKPQEDGNSDRKPIDNRAIAVEQTQKEDGNSDRKPTDNPEVKGATSNDEKKCPWIAALPFLLLCIWIALLWFSARKDRYINKLLSFLSKIRIRKNFSRRRRWFVRFKWIWIFLIFTLPMLSYFKLASNTNNLVFLKESFGMPLCILVMMLSIEWLIFMREQYHGHTSNTPKGENHSHSGTLSILVFLAIVIDICISIIEMHGIKFGEPYLRIFVAKLAAAILLGAICFFVGKFIEIQRIQKEEDMQTMKGSVERLSDGFKLIDVQHKSKEEYCKRDHAQVREWSTHR